MSRVSSYLMVGAISVNTVLLAWGALQHSPSWAEVGHLPAGLSHLHLRNFDLYAVNPPAIRMWAAAPVALASPKTNWTIHENDAGSRNEFAIGLKFLEANQMRSFWLFTIARWACIPFSWLGAYVCYRWATELYGARPGIVAAMLWCFSPSVLGYGSMIVPAVGATSIGLLGNYLFWHWLKHPTWRRTLANGLVLGAIELTKTTWIVLYAIWPALWLFWICRCQHRERMIRGQFAQLLTMVLISVYIINVGYLFEGSLKPLGSFEFVSRSLSGQQLKPPETGNRFHSSPLRYLPVPLPKNYVSGIDLQRRDFEDQKWSYLRGEWRHGGWWYFYLYAMVLKIPAGVLLLLLIAVATRIGYDGRVLLADELALILPAATVLILVSSQTGINHHFRYVLPAFPAIFIFCSRVFRYPNRNRLLSRIASFCVVWGICSSLWIWPHSISYFNEFAGGPRNGHWHLGGSIIDTNIDCGQDLLYLKKWISAHPEAKGLRVALIGPVNPRLVGIFAPEPPPAESGATQNDKSIAPAPGWFAVSVNRLHSQEGEYSYFLNYEPIDTIGYSIHIYKIDPVPERNKERNKGRNKGVRTH